MNVVFEMLESPPLVGAHRAARFRRRKNDGGHARSQTLEQSFVSGGILTFYFASTRPEFVDPWIRGLNESGVRYHSRIADGVSDVLEYLVRDPRVESGEVKTCCLVLSDLENNIVSSRGDTGARLKRALASYKKCNGIMAFYFASTQSSIIDPWIRGLNESGVQYRLESKIVDYPILPSFD